MKRSAVLLGIALLGAATQALAIDTVDIRNTTDSKLRYKMRCTDPQSDWKVFSTEAHQTDQITAKHCEKFGFEMSTNKNDGSKVTVKYQLHPNSWYRLVYNRDKDRWDLKKVKKTDF
jgi:Pyruvate/2-oxoacid:ferredoxin oxidoreductase delta subunit